MKRLLNLFFAVVLILSTFSCASAVIISGAKVSGDYEYTINSDNKTATIVYYNGNFEKKR